MPQISPTPEYPEVIWTKGDSKGIIKAELPNDIRITLWVDRDNDHKSYVYWHVCVGILPAQGIPKNLGKCSTVAQAQQEAIHAGLLASEMEKENYELKLELERMTA